VSVDELLDLATTAAIQPDSDPLCDDATEGRRPRRPPAALAPPDREVEVATAAAVDALTREGADVVAEDVPVPEGAADAPAAGAFFTLPAFLVFALNATNRVAEVTSGDFRKVRIINAAPGSSKWFNHTR